VASPFFTNVRGTRDKPSTRTGFYPHLLREYAVEKKKKKKKKKKRFYAVGAETEVCLSACRGLGSVVRPLLAARALPLRCAASTVLSSALLAI
jgi:hypothetical protein